MANIMFHKACRNKELAVPEVDNEAFWNSSQISLLPDCRIEAFDLMVSNLLDNLYCRSCATVSQGRSSDQRSS